MATGVVGDLPGKHGADVGDARDVHQELRELVRAVVNRARFLEVDGIVAEDRLVLVDDHVTARAGRDDDRVVRRGQQIEGVAAEGARFVQIPAVEGRLAAARLPGRALDRDSQPFEHRHDGHPGIREEPIHETRDEELNPRRADGSHSAPLCADRLAVVASAKFRSALS